MLNKYLYIKITNILREKKTFLLLLLLKKLGFFYKKNINNRNILVI